MCYYCYISFLEHIYLTEIPLFLSLCIPTPERSGAAGVFGKFRIDFDSYAMKALVIISPFSPLSLAP